MACLDIVGLWICERITKMICNIEKHSSCKGNENRKGKRIYKISVERRWKLSSITIKLIVYILWEIVLKKEEKGYSIKDNFDLCDDSNGRKILQRTEKIRLECLVVSLSYKIYS